MSFTMRPGLGMILIGLLAIALIAGALGLVSASLIATGLFLIAFPFAMIIWGVRKVTAGSTGWGVVLIVLGVSFLGLAWIGGALIFFGFVI